MFSEECLRLRGDLQKVAEAEKIATTAIVAVQTTAQAAVEATEQAATEAFEDAAKVAAEVATGSEQKLETQRQASEAECERLRDQLRVARNAEQKAKAASERTLDTLPSAP